MPKTTPLYATLLLSILPLSSPSLSDDIDNTVWSEASSWLYATLSAQFEDHAGDYQHAMQTIAGVADASGQYEAFQYSFYLALDILQLPKAETLARQWLQHYPDDNEARQALLTTLLQQDKATEAFALMQAMLEKAPEPQTIAIIVRLLTYVDNGVKRLSIIQRLSDTYPDNPYLLYYSGLIAREIGHIAQAIEAFDKALKIDQNWRQLKLMQAQALSSIGDIKRAQALMQTLHQQHPEDEQILSTMIDMAVDHYQWQHALQLAQTWQQLAPQDSRITHLIAWLNLNAGNYSQALIDYRQLLDDQLIDLNEYLFQTANAAEQVQAYDVAQQKLAQLDPACTLYMIGQQNKALIYFKQGATEQAMQAFTRLRQEFSDHALEMYLLEINQLNRLGNSEAADTLLQQALQQYPQQVDLLYAQAEWQTLNQNWQQAEQTYQTILAIDPANIDALNAYGYLLLVHTDRLDEATTMIEQAIAAYPDSPAIQDSYGWLLFQQGDTEQALTWLRRAYAAYRKNEITPHYIEILNAANQRQLAQDIYQRERSGQPDNALLIQTGEKLGFNSTP